MSPRRIIPPLFVFISVCMAAPTAVAEKSWNASVYASSKYDDNISRANSDSKSDVVYTLGASIGGAARTDRHTLTAAYDLSKDYYKQNSFKDRTNLTGSLGLRSMLMEQRLYWVVNHRQTTTLTNARLRDTPDNRQERSSVSTGPQLYFRPSQRDSLSYSALYSKTDLEESDENENYDINQSVTWSRILSEVTNLNLSGSHTETSFEENDDNDYERSSVSLGLSGQRPLFNYSVSAGKNKIQPAVGEDFTGSTFSANLSKSHHGLNYSLTASRQLTDTITAATETEDAIVPVDPLLDSNVGVISIVERTNVSAGVTGIQLSDRMTSSLTVSQQESKSEDEQAIDQEQQQGTAALVYAISDRLSCSSSLSYRETDFIEDPVRTDKSRVLRVGVDYVTPRGISASFSVNHEKRSSDDSNANYDSLSAIATVSYSFGRE